MGKRRLLSKGVAVRWGARLGKSDACLRPLRRDRRKGIFCGKMTYRERMQILYNTVLCVSKAHSDSNVERMVVEESKFMARNNENDLTVIPKRYVPKGDLKNLWDDRNASLHKNDGIIFTLNSAPVETGTSKTILKWKPTHSVDIK
eukprot:2466653-Prymnesium_polylepis.2